MTKKVKIANVIAISIGAIIGILGVSTALYGRIENLGGLHLNVRTVIAAIILFCIPIVWVYALMRGTCIALLLEREKNKEANEKSKEFREKFKDNFKDGEREVSFLYDEYDTESYILGSIIKYYEPIYIAKLKSDDTVDLIIKDKKTKEIISPPININSIEDFESNFKFCEDKETKN